MASYEVYFSNAGVPATGLTLTWESLVKRSDGVDEVSPPEFTELGVGWYKFSYSPTEPMVGVIDGSDTLEDADRYLPCKFTANDEAVTELRLGELDPANLPTDIAEISSKIDGIGSVGGFQTAVAESFTLTTGTVVAGTYASTHAEDGVRHQIADSGGVIDGYYEFDISTIGVPSAFQIIGALTGSNDSLSIMAYNWSTLAWDTLRSYSGTVSSSDTVKTGILLSTHVSDAGKVRIRFYGTGLTSANLYVNQLFSQYGVVQSATGYEGGAVWIDTVNGTAGSVPDVNGTADNPVDNMADALVIAAAKSLARFHAAPGSAIVLPSAFVSKQFEGCGWTLDLNGQDISYSRFACAVMVTGAATAPTGAPQFDSCDLGAVTLPPSHIHLCGISASITGESAGEYAITHCYSLVPGSGTPTFNFSGLPMPTGINVRNWSGGTSWVLDSNCTLSLEVINGGGQTFLSSGANIELRGRFRSSTFTLSGSGTIQQVGTCGPITISGTAVTTIRLYGVRADLTNTSVGTTVVDQCVTEQKISILSTSSEITDVRSDISGVKSDTESAAVMLEDVSDRIPIRLVNGRMNSQVSAVRNGMVEDEDDDVSPEIITQLSDITTGLFDEDIYNGVSTLTSTCTELRLAELDQANIPADIAAISGVDPQDIRDAMKLAPTAGAPESGSVDAIISSTASICTEPRLSQLDNDYLPTAVYATRAQVNEIELDTANIQARIPAALVNGRTPADVGSMQDNVITANKIATDAITAAKVSADAVTKIQTGLATAAAVSNSQNTYTLVTAIKAIVDLLPDAGALTSIAKEATVGSPAGASIAADIAEVLSSLGVTDDRLTDETSGLGALKSVVEAVPTEMLASTIDGSADFAIAMKKILAYCTGIIVRTGSVYAYRDYDNTANALVLTGTADGRTRF